MCSITFAIVYSLGMDALSTLLHSQSGAGVFTLRCEMNAPWSVKIADQSQAAVVAVLRGTLCLSGRGELAPIGAGSLVVISGPDPYVLSDQVNRPPNAVVMPGQVCESLDSAVKAEPIVLRANAWGNADSGECAFLVGVFEVPSQINTWLLGALPPIAVLSPSEVDLSLVALLEREIDAPKPGQQAVLDRLCDLLLITSLRSWFGLESRHVPRGWRGYDDPMVAHLLRLIHDRPAYPWALVSLANEVGYSRALVARRFKEVVGQSPIAYLTEWRMSLAADRLAASTNHIDEVARGVGYANPFAFSTAFKRRYGLAPRAFRARAVVGSTP
jgi:AraC-like DNA-binding protein